MQPDDPQISILFPDEKNKSCSILRCQKENYYISSSELANPIAANSFGSIYKGTTTTGSIVAIKRIPLTGTNVTTIQEEIDSMQALKTHQNIVSYWDSGYDTDSFYIVMKYYENGSLTNLIESKSASDDPKNILEHFRQICYGIKQIHDLKFMHKNLKTDNVLVEKNGCPYCCTLYQLILNISDFGIVKSADNVTNNFVNIGTASTKAPEAYNGGFDYKADIYSLGCIFYKMIFKKEPFTGSNEIELLESKKIGLNSNLLDALIRQRFPKYNKPELFVEILMKCLEPNAVTRWGPQELYDKIEVETLYLPKNNLLNMQNFQKLFECIKRIKINFYLHKQSANLVANKLRRLNLSNGEIFKKYHQLMKTLYLINDYINIRIRMQSTVELFKTSLTRKELLMDQMCQVKKSLHSVIEAVTTSNHLRYHSPKGKVRFCNAFEILLAMFFVIAIYTLYNTIIIGIKK